jgi:hypothetical protein
MRMVTNTCYVHDVDGSHVCLEVLTVSMMMMMMMMMMVMMMMMMMGRLCRSYAQSHPLQYSHLHVSFLYRLPTRSG